MWGQDQLPVLSSQAPYFILWLTLGDGGGKVLLFIRILQMRKLRFQQERIYASIGAPIFLAPEQQAACLQDTQSGGLASVSREHSIPGSIPGSWRQEL